MWLKIGGGAVLISLTAAAAFFPVGDWIASLIHWSRAAGLAGALVYAAVFIAAVVLMVPGAVLTMGAGMLYGQIWGVALASPASVAGATLAFAFGRSFARGVIARWMASTPRFGAVDAAIGEHGLRIVILIRLSPLFPFNVLNYALGITAVRPRDYLLGSFIGMLPGAFLYAYIGSLLGEVASSVDMTGAGMARHALSAIGLAATIGATIVVTRVARRAPRSRDGSSARREHTPVLTRRLHGQPQARGGATSVPTDWQNRILPPADNLVVIGGGAAGLVSAVAGAGPLGPRSEPGFWFVERRLLRWRR